MKLEQRPRRRQSPRCPDMVMAHSPAYFAVLLLAWCIAHGINHGHTLSIRVLPKVPQHHLGDTTVKTGQSPGHQLPAYYMAVDHRYTGNFASPVSCVPLWHSPYKLVTVVNTKSCYVPHTLARHHPTLQTHRVRAAAAVPA